jgi:thiol-disulfide isomerase/thioredoxin
MEKWLWILITFVLAAILLMIVYKWYKDEKKETYADEAAASPFNDDKVHALLFYGDFCGHCVQFKPVWAQFEKVVASNPEYSDKVVVHTYSVEDPKNKQLSDSFKVSGIPDVRFVKESRVVAYSGDRSLASLEDSLKKFLARS